MTDETTPRPDFVRPLPKHAQTRIQVLKQEIAVLQVKLLTARYGTYEDDEGHEWLNAPGACGECCDGQRGEIDGDWGQGHFLCGTVPADILRADKDGIIGGMLHNNGWHWFLYALTPRPDDEPETAER